MREQSVYDHESLIYTATYKGCGNADDEYEGTNNNM